MKLRTIIISLAIVLLITTGVLASNNKITIANQVKVRGMEVKLSQIATITGTTKFKNNVKGVIIGQAPLPGYQRVIYRDEIIAALRRKNIDLSKIFFNVPYQFTVKADYKEIPKEMLIAKGKNYIYKQLNYNKDQIKIEVSNLPRQIMRPYGNLELEVENNYRSYQNRLLGTTMIPIKIKVDGRLYKRIYVQYRVQLLKKVLVAKEKLKRKQAINRDLFKVEQRAIINNNNTFVESDHSLEGKQMKVSLAPGQVLLTRMIELPALVKRWQEVTIIAKVSGIEVSTTGKAREEGHLGEIIKIKNKTSGNTVEGKVVGKNKVEVIIN